MSSAHSVTSTTTNTTVTSLYRGDHHPITEASAGVAVASIGNNNSSSSQAIQALMIQDAGVVTRQDSSGGISSSSFSSLPTMPGGPSPAGPPILPQASVDDFMAALDRSLDEDTTGHFLDDTMDGELSLQLDEMDPSCFLGDDDDDVDGEDGFSESRGGASKVRSNSGNNSSTKKHEWLLRMNRKLQEVPVGELDPATVPLSAVMNAWAKTKSAQGAAMVELWLKRAQEEYDAGNRRVVPSTKMYTMAGKYYV